jgi:hypothetical protein
MFSMSEKKQVHIGDLYATQFHHFPFQVGDEVTVQSSGKKGIVEDAIWEGEVPAGFYTLTYYLITKDGEKLEVEFADLKGWDK